MAEEDSVVAIVHATQVAEDSVLLAVEVAEVLRHHLPLAMQL